MHLPIHPHPRADETLAGYVRRVADENLTTPTDVGWTARGDPLSNHRLDWERIATTTGRTVQELRDLTPFRYPATVAGSGCPGARNTRWRASLQQRGCPTCTGCRGRRRDWDLLLTLCCLDCRQLLQPLAADDVYPEIPEGDGLLSTQAAINVVLAESDRRHKRDRLSRLHRLVRVASLTADNKWPPVPSAYLSRIREERDLTWEPWTPARAPADPIVVATLVAAGWESLGSRHRQRAFLSEAWTRIEIRGVCLTRAERASLPAIPPDPDREPRSVRPRRGAVSAAARTLTDAGLTSANVPLLLLGADEFLPPLHELRRRHHLATLVRAALGPTTKSDPNTAAENLRLRPHPGPEDSPTIAELRPFIATLLAREPIDYTHARTALTVIPRTTCRETGLPPESWPMAAAWIWTHHTRGPLLRAVHKVRLIDLVEFHRRLDPEQRLLLHELGRQQVTWTADLHNQATRERLESTRVAM